MTRWAILLDFGMKFQPCDYCRNGAKVEQVALLLSVGSEEGDQDNADHDWVR